MVNVLCIAIAPCFGILQIGYFYRPMVGILTQKRTDRIPRIFNFGDFGAKIIRVASGKAKFTAPKEKVRSKSDAKPARNFGFSSLFKRVFCKRVRSSPCTPKYASDRSLECRPIMLGNVY